MSQATPSFLSETPVNSPTSRKARRRISFIDSTLRSVAKTIKSFYIHSESGQSKSALSAIHPKIKVLAFIFLIVTISIARTLHGQLAATFFIVVLLLFSKVKLKYLYRKILFLSFFFGFLIFMPAMLNVISPGKIVCPLFSFAHEHEFWIYKIPATIGITDTGIHLVSILFLRVFNSISLSLVFVYSTSFSKLIQGFKVFYIPDMFLMVLTLTYKFIVILSKAIEDTYMALRSRLFGTTSSKDIRAIVPGRILFIFKKARSNYERTYDAMVSRGYNGKVVLQKKQILRFADICFLVGSSLAGTIILML